MTKTTWPGSFGAPLAEPVGFDAGAVAMAEILVLRSQVLALRKYAVTGNLQ
jgi:hypothetical protein